MNQKFLEALQEKGIAEKMMIRNDYVTAREHLLEAKKLSPGIDNIGSMLTLCDILSAASLKFPGYGIDYYWILQLTPSATQSVIRNRHQKLVSMLQPIIRTFPGTELALKHIHDAFLVLSNNETRSTFDLKRGTGREDYLSFEVQAPLTQSISDRETISTAQSSSMDFQSHLSDGSKKTAEALSIAVGNSVEKQLTFEDNTNQHGIGMQRIGEEIGTSSYGLPTILEGIVTCQVYYNFEDDRKPHYLEEGQIWAAHYRAQLLHTYRYAQISINSNSAVCITWLKPIPISPGERRWCDKGLPVACGSFELVPEMKKEEVSWQIISSYKCSWTRGITKDQFEIYPKKGEIWALYKDWDLDDWSNDPDAVKGCRFELVEVISEFSKFFGADAACLVKVNGLKSVFKRQTMGGNPITCHISPSNIYMFSHNVPAYRFRGGEIDNIADGMFELDQMALPDYMIQDMVSQQSPNVSGSLLSRPRSNPISIQNPENKNLKPGSTQKHLETGQVWAVYCGKDLMPRQYIRINGIIAENQVFGTMLEPLPIIDHEIHWQKENLPMACGIFKVSGSSVNLNMSLFSYVVRCQQSKCKSFYRIYPQKGEIWAMYRHWNAKWKCSNHENSQYQIVQVLSGFEDVVKVARLVEVKGYLTFFHRLQYDGFDLTYTVCKEEKLSFSHRIPAFRVPGIGKVGIPEDSWHLEPDALPPKRGK
ncbi:hypothetical protein REPUB_Repub07fG0017400 [Reevesia pubescens]